ncbi:MAG: MOSC domain-containing protein [Croceibacterium sp.]
MSGQIVAVSSDGLHRFAKPLRPAITLLAGLGVEGDAHCGTTVQHLSRRRKAPEAVNARQVHLLQAELIDALAAAGFAVTPGAMGENVTTRGIDLLALPRGARLRLGSKAEVEVTGLRNPCAQIDAAFGPGAMAATLDRAPDGSLVRKAGVMAIVVRGGDVRPGDPVAITHVPAERVPLEPV